MRLRRVVAWSTFPGLLLGAVMVTEGLLSRGYSPSLSVTLVIASAVIALLVLQKVIPWRPEWAGTPKQFSVDLLHSGSTTLTTDLWRAAGFGVLFGTSAYVTEWLGFSLWPSSWPWPAELALALIVGDFGAYWVHRACHRLPLLWRVHAMHHSSERLYVLSSGRNHPGNVILAYGSQVFPLILLGAPLEVLALLSVFTGVHGLLQHANVDLKHGPLNFVFATADRHRWHHSADFDESNTNFGSNLILWDLVFGTAYLPVDRPGPERAGLEGMEIPENFFAQMGSPLVLERYSTDEVPLPTTESLHTQATSHT